MSSRSTKLQMQERIQSIIELKIRRNIPDEKIIDTLVKHFKKDKRTIQRDMKAAKQLLSQYGASLCSEELGKLKCQLDDTYAFERNKPDPDTNKLNRIIQAKSKHLKDWAHMKGGAPFERNTQTTPADRVSPELQALLDRFGNAETNSP
jgi:hypothetical protein